MANFEISGYELYEVLGRGGMAVVYRALHLNLDRAVAIKIMDTALNSDETFSERFIREARISARLVHPHILQIYDVNSFDTLNYISMELLEGGDLSDFIRSSMKQSVLYEVMEQMTQALDYAAGKGYVHRDIKPSNIMLRGDGEFVLADFGIAKAANSGTQMTQTGLMVGTPSYMSPEQAKGIEVDGRSDLYGLAVLCYEMLTKTLPYDSDSAVATAVKHLTDPIPTLPENLAAYQPFLDKAMAKDPDERYQTGREMYRGFCEVRGQFAEDDVLTEGTTSSRQKPTGSENLAGSRTSIAGSDLTQVAAPSRPSRPYKLADTGQREPLVSGIRSGQRTVPRESSSSFGSTGFRLFAGLVVIGALSFGGYTFLQGKKTSSAEDLRAVTSELATAYGALNDDDYEKAIIAFRKVLSIDSGHAAARQGLSEVEASFGSAIDRAIDSGDIDRAQSMFGNYSLHFVDSDDAEGFALAIEQAKQDKQLVSVQSQRIEILLGKASTAMEQGRFFEPMSDNAYEFIKQAIAMDADSAMASEGLDKFVMAAVDNVYVHISEARFGDARDLLTRIRQVSPELPVLDEAQSLVGRAEQAELQRQERWATFSQEDQQSILNHLALAEDLMAKGILTSAEQGDDGENAYDHFLFVLGLDAENDSAVQGPGRIAKAYIVLAEDAMMHDRFEEAEQSLDNAATVAPEFSALQEQREHLVEARSAYAEQSQLRSQLDELLARASDQLQRAGQGSRYTDAAVELYQEVLQLDPENETAREGLLQVTDFYISSANEAIAYGEFKTAMSALNSAQRLAPEREDIAQQIKDLSGKESEWVTGQNVSVLIDSGEQLAAQGDYTGAAGKFSTALKLESSSTAAAQGLDVAVESLLQRALEGIEKGDFSSARDDLTDAEEFAPTREDIADQIAQLPAAEQAWQHNQALKQGIEEAEAFYKKGQLSNAAKAYSEVLAVDPESSVANEGFDKSITALINGAKSSTKKGDFTRARNNLASAEKLAPGNADAARLLADIPRLEQEWQKKQAAAAQQQQLATELASTVESAMAVNDLYSAADNYSELAAAFPDLASTRKLKRELVAAFADATRTQINDEDYDAARAYLSRGQVLEPNHADWGELEDEIEISTSGNRRRLGAF